MRKMLEVGIAACVVGCASAPLEPQPTLLFSTERHEALGEVVSNMEVSTALREYAVRPELAQQAVDAQIDAMIAYARAHGRGDVPASIPNHQDGVARLAVAATTLAPYLDLDSGFGDLSRVGFEALAAKLGEDADYDPKPALQSDRAPLGRELIDGIAVLAPEYIDAEVAERMAAALAQWADGSPKPRALLLDLAHCSGGTAGAATELFNELAPGKVAFLLGTRESHQQGLLHRELEGKRSWGADLYTQAPLFVVTSTQTDGVCEALAAGLRKERGAQIIGGATSGRGRIMSYFDLPDGGQFGFAIAELFTNDGAPLSGSPVLPDVCLGADEALARLTPRDAASYGLRCKAIQELHRVTVLQYVRASLPVVISEPLAPLENGQPQT